MKCRFQQYLVRTEILSTFHVRVIYIYVWKYVILPIQTNGGANAEKSPKQPLPLGARESHLTDECLGRAHSPRQTIAARSSTQLCNKGLNGFNGTPLIHHQNCPFPSNDHYPHLIHPSLDHPHSPSQTASGSNQPFCHSTFSGQIDRQIDTKAHTQTNRWARQQVRNMSAYAQTALRERRVNSVKTCFCIRLALTL